MEEYNYLMENSTNFNKLSILKRFAAFYTQTLDKIASPGKDELIPEFLFNIRHLITRKLSNKREHLEFLKSYVKELNKHEKYDLKPAKAAQPENDPESAEYKAQK